LDDEFTLPLYAINNMICRTVSLCKRKVCFVISNTNSLLNVFISVQLLKVPFILNRTATQTAGGNGRKITQIAN